MEKKEDGGDGMMECLGRFRVLASFVSLSPLLAFGEVEEYDLLFVVLKKFEQKLQRSSDESGLIVMLVVALRMFRYKERRRR